LEAEMKNWTSDKIILTVLLSIIGFFLMQTFFGIKNLEKDVVTIRVKLAEFEAKRISREEIEKIIRDYHDNHPCINKRSKND
jgi:cell division protein FtsB